MTQDAKAAVEYARRLYDDVLGWYRSADTKAQIILGIDGAFVAFTTSGIFAKPADIKAIVDAFSFWTWLFLLLMMLSLLCSFTASIYCLWSRIYSEAQVQNIIRAGTSDGGAKAYDANIMWFFQMVASLKDEAFRRTLEQADSDFETRAMASQIHVLSGNVRRKHHAVNIGFLTAVSTMLLFLVAGISYALKSAF